ncbi:hypothetical protein LCGC14_1375600 [marine sediment metagenome]|uniref:Uncharacterized protein n=1 Tax=marine sediment metagenome TaxID=412755 RepID=A0A0F9N655_9ZZZZ
MSTPEQVMMDEEVDSLKKVAETTEALVIKLGEHKWDVYHDLRRICVSHKMLSGRIKGLEELCNELEVQLTDCVYELKEEREK